MGRGRVLENPVGGVILAGLNFSHWIVDLCVHHNDMPWLPGNLGDFPLLGFGLWDSEHAVFGTELVLVLTATVFYFRWSRKEQSSRFWFAGPAVLATLFVALAAGDIPTGPMS